VLFSEENRVPNTYSDPKFGQKRGGVIYIDARKKGPGTLFQLASF
jgi:hypothetical protein